MKITGPVSYRIQLDDGSHVRRHVDNIRKRVSQSCKELVNSSSGLESPDVIQSTDVTFGASTSPVENNSSVDNSSVENNSSVDNNSSGDSNSSVRRSTPRSLFTSYFSLSYVYALLYACVCNHYFSLSYV